MLLMLLLDGADWILRLASGPENASQLVTMRADAAGCRPVPFRPAANVLT